MESGTGATPGPMYFVCMGMDLLHDHNHGKVSSAADCSWIMKPYMVVTLEENGRYQTALGIGLSCQRSGRYFCSTMTVSAPWRQQ